MSSNEITLAITVCIAIICTTVMVSLIASAESFKERLTLALCAVFGLPVVLAGVALLIAEVFNIINL